MASGGYRFDRFELDPEDRRLTRDGAPVELNARYLDALILLVRENGRLITKDRFLDEVWKGVPVTDEALTQCIRTLRRTLDDDAARPRFIATAPKHGYRFVAEIASADAPAPPDPAPTPTASAAPRARPWTPFLMLGAAGIVGGGVAGLVGGLIYGFIGAADPLQPGLGAGSVLMVLACLTVIVSLMGGFGVAMGIAVAGILSRRIGPWSIVGGAVGGMMVGGIVRALGVDAFNLLLGQSPGDITGAPEGAILGGAVGLAAWLTVRRTGRGSLRYGVAVAALCGAAAGLIIPLAGGRMMGGSLELLADQFPASRLRLSPIGALFGETGFGPIAQAFTGALEGLLFSACLVGAMIVARRNLGRLRTLTWR